MYILVTLTFEQLISKVTQQQQRTHAIYTSLGTQTCRAVNTSNTSIRMDRSSHIHRSTGTTRTARR